MYRKLREPVNSITHFAGAILSFIALIAMISKTIMLNGTSTALLSVVIFGVSLILLYTVSGTYHGVVSSDKVITILKKLDHSMIFILIAGSYAPFCLIALNNTTGLITFIVLISIAIAGIVFKLLWFSAPRWLQTTLYIVMGWSALFIIGPLSKVMSPISIFLLVLGGILYTIGGVIYGAKPKKLKFGIFGFHEIFHIFILLGSLAHFICVFIYIL